MLPDNARDALLAASQRDFPAFYGGASVADADALDALVLARAALAVTMNIPRDNLTPAVRTEIERATHANEETFTYLREIVHGCVAFERLEESERERIERVVFEVSSPVMQG